jgi:phospholipid transport system substrate-binding protein
MAVIAAMPFGGSAYADTAPAGATAAITNFNNALLGAMKAGARTDFNHRFQTLAPAVEQAFDLPAVLAVSVGPSWARLQPRQQTKLLRA